MEEEIKRKTKNWTEKEVPGVYLCVFAQAVLDI